MWGMQTLPWSTLTWLNEPPSAIQRHDRLEVLTGEQTDFWRQTSYGFTHDNGHLLGAALSSPAAIEVTFRSDLSEQFDQAGLMLQASPRLWLKAGLERSDGRLFASVVATVGFSDWSVAPVREIGADEPVTVRASREGDAVTVRSRLGETGEWQLMRVAYFPPDEQVVAGPMCCSPTRSGLLVRFEPVRVGPPDETLHEAQD
jgi:regulation of enolase protein 1 (concanavalin A-like superfamily)